MEYVLGLAFGVAVGLGLIVLLFRKKVLDMTFDERQELARGKACQYGFFTLMGCVILWGFLETAVGVWCTALAGGILCICISLLVYATVCIRRDAYLSLKETPRKVVTVFILVTAMNLLAGAVHVMDGTVVENGMLTDGSVNLMLGVTTLIITIVYLAYRCLRGQEEAE